MVAGTASRDTVAAGKARRRGALPRPFQQCLTSITAQEAYVSIQWYAGSLIFRVHQMSESQL